MRIAFRLLSGIVGVILVGVGGESTRVGDRTPGRQSRLKPIFVER